MRTPVRVPKTAKIFAGDELHRGIGGNNSGSEV